MFLYMGVTTDQILSKLKDEYGLKEKDVLIIKAIRYEKATAEQICKITKIPLGRVYSYLNKLVSKGLIERTSKKPYYYVIKDFNKNIISFMKDTRHKFVKKEAEVLKLMKGPGSEHIETIDTKEKFTQFHLNIIAEGQIVKITGYHGSFPYILYPNKWDEFIRLRHLVLSKRDTISFTDDETAYLVFKTYREALANGVKFEVIFEKNAFDNHLNMMLESWGKPYVQKFLKNLKKKLNQHSIKIYLLDEFLPLQADINENRVGLALIKKGSTTGAVIFSKNMVQIHSLIFEQRKERTIDLEQYLKKYEGIF